jgi:hypothetical protein
MIQNPLPLYKYLPWVTSIAGLPTTKIGSCSTQEMSASAQPVSQPAILKLVPCVNVSVRTPHASVLNNKSKTQSLSMVGAGALRRPAFGDGCIRLVLPPG